MIWNIGLRRYEYLSKSFIPQKFNNKKNFSVIRSGLRVLHSQETLKVYYLHRLFETKISWSWEQNGLLKLENIFQEKAKTRITFNLKRWKWEKKLILAILIISVFDAKILSWLIAEIEIRTLSVVVEKE